MFWMYGGGFIMGDASEENYLPGPLLDTKEVGDPLGTKGVAEHKGGRRTSRQKEGRRTQSRKNF